MTLTTKLRALNYTIAESLSNGVLLLIENYFLKGDLGGFDFWSLLTEAYQEFSQTSTMVLFYENVLSQMFDWVLNMAMVKFYLKAWNFT